MATVAVRDYFSPVLHAGRCNGCFANTEILSAARVGRYDEAVAIVLNVILMLLLACCDNAQRLTRRIGVNEIDLARLVIVCVY